MGIGLQIKELASERNISLPELAKKLGKTKQAIYDIIEKDDVNTALLRECSKIFGVPVAYFFQEDEPRNSANATSGVALSGNTLISSPIDNRHYYSDSPDVLRAQIDMLDERIKEKDAQIKEKDAQIKQLLDILQGAK